MTGGARPAALPRAGRATLISLPALLLILLLAVLLPAAMLPAADVTEAALKAAFVYNFTKLVTWPESALGAPGAPFVVAVAGRNGLGSELEAALKGKNACGRPIEVRRWSTVEDIGHCHILWLSAELVADDDAMRRVLKAPAVLVVGDAEGIARRGGMVRLYREETPDGVKLRFEFNVEAARAAGLEVSSKLLSLARIVTGTVPERR